MGDLVACSEIDFALKLLSQRDPSESFVFSPASIAIGLALVHSAAKEGETRDEIRSALLNGTNDLQFQQHFSKFISALPCDNSKAGPAMSEVNVANHVFCNANFRVKKDYLDSVKKLYNCDASRINFNDAKRSAETVNQFVDVNTKGNIKEIISASNIKPGDAAVVTSAIFFKSQWDRRYMFFKSDTAKKEFFSSVNVKREIDFMNQIIHMKYNDNDVFQVINLPYKNGSFSMSIFLPKIRFGLAEALKKSDSPSIYKLLSEFGIRYADITIPKWKLETSMDLNKSLEDLGIKDVFKEGGLQNLANGAFLSKCAHKATIEVDEYGTTASAAFASLCGGGIPPKPVNFVADHPFLYMITMDLHPLFVGIHN